MTRVYSHVMAMVVFATVLPTGAGAQTFSIVPPIAGACEVRITLPAPTASVRELLLDGKALPLDRMTKAGELDVVVRLRGPLRERDQLKAALVSGDPPPAVAVVGPGVSGDIPCEGPAKKPADDRPVFELVGFYGIAVDNFAPTFAVGYSDSAGLSRTRRTFGLITKYRLFKDAGDRQQLWVDGATLNGLRTADISCKDDQAVLCTNGRPDTTITLKNVQDAGVQVIEQASTIEAHLGLRYEFLTLQPKSPTPAKMFAFYRYGFIAMVDPEVTCGKTDNVPASAEIKVDSACTATTTSTTNPTTSSTLVGGQPTAFTQHYMGFGFTLPAGPFRDTGVTWGWAKEEIFTNADHWRRKLNAVAIFDILPQFSDGPGKWLGSGTARFFIALSVDRAFGGHKDGPDSIQTYLGLAFDLGKAFRL